MVSDNPESFADLDGHKLDLQSNTVACATGGSESCDAQQAAAQNSGTAQNQTPQTQSSQNDGQKSDKDGKDKDTTPTPADAGTGGKGGGKNKGERNQTAKPDNATKGVKPIRDKEGKITGWLVPSQDGKGKQKTLDWGKANGLDPNNFKKVAVGVGIVGAAGLTHTIIATAPEWAPWLALAF
jgi:hypothetical protein